jgi:drug/metabolite transporter (DMT)-like permease
MRAERAAWTAAAVALVVWAAAFAAIRAALDELSPTELSAARLLVASAVFGAAAPIVRYPLPHRRDLARLAACGAAGMAGYQLFLTIGERRVEAGTASLIVNTAPLFATVLAAVLLGERITGRTVAGVAVAFAGSSVIVAGGADVSVNVGALWVLGAAVCHAVYFVLQKPLLGRYRAADVVAWSTWLGTALLLPLSAHVPAAVGATDIDTWAAVAFLGVGASVIGFFSWSLALTRLPVSVASAALYCVPVIAIAVAYVVLGEQPAASDVVGGAVALAGVALATTTRRPQQIRGPVKVDEPTASPSGG